MRIRFFDGPALSTVFDVDFLMVPNELRVRAKHEVLAEDVNDHDADFVVQADGPEGVYHYRRHQTDEDAVMYKLTGRVDVESDGQMLARLGTDGEAWAREWLVRNPLSDDRLGSDAATEDDLDTMLGWFANAIEAGRSAGWSEGVRGCARLDSTRASRVARPGVVAEVAMVRHEGGWRIEIRERTEHEAGWRAFAAVEAKDVELALRMAAPYLRMLSEVG